MLITSRTYQQSQASRENCKAGTFGAQSALGWGVSPGAVQSALKMLLIHQVGSVRVGEVVRYTLTYTPSLDVPSPPYLHVKIKNTSAIPLRAAWVHGPYTLYTACYPATFDPNDKRDGSLQGGAPAFEPNLKAGGSWLSRLTVPENIRETRENPKARSEDGSRPSITWIIEIASQVIFSMSAAVHFELLVGKDEKSIESSFSNLMGQSASTPGQLEDHQQSSRSKDGHHSAAQPKGVFSHAVHLILDDTASLWNKPALPEWSDDSKDRIEANKPQGDGVGSKLPVEGERRAKTALDSNRKNPQSKKRKIHLVVLTHGLHSNLGSDMLYLKESIDAAAKQARESARERKRRDNKQNSDQKSKADPINGRIDHSNKVSSNISTAPLPDGQDQPGQDRNGDDDDDDEEHVIVRGFPDNATKTEKGIKYLGKRLARWVLKMTYPDQPFLPAKASVKKKLSRALSGDMSPDGKGGHPQHSHSSIYEPSKKPKNLAYKITSISFIAHSLGGLTQTYAIAYIQKHSPHFFDEIKPINFVAMATPFLGLSNENPLYVRFALDFGLVGRTGQDLGLTWRPPTMVRNGWGAMIGGLGSESQRAQKQLDPQSKPLLRILPTSYTHQVLKKFRNRTVYSNVVNDGIVPLRTSCLLFLDWSGLGRVEKARRENGIVGTMAGWGWAELTGANSSANRHLRPEHDGEASSQTSVSGDESSYSSRKRKEKAEVPQPEENAVRDDSTIEGKGAKAGRHIDPQGRIFEGEEDDSDRAKDPTPQRSSNPMTGFLSFLRPNQPKSQHVSPKQTKIYKRGQTRKGESGVASPASDASPSVSSSEPSRRPSAVRGDSFLESPDNVHTPPKTTIFEAAGDILKPPLPSTDWLIDPTRRPRTIFHDRVYHPDDIPKPPVKRSRTTNLEDGTDNPQADTGGMKVEEKIARAYHNDLTWRKVLVRLEPDAHNNMVVRRMFANAYGWPVIKHLVDTHFADTYAAATADEDEPSHERAKPINEAVGDDGEEIVTGILHNESELREAHDDVPDLKGLRGSSFLSSSINRPIFARQDSAQWDDTLFEGTDDEDDIDTPIEARQRFHVPSQDSLATAESSSSSAKGTSEAEIAEFLHGSARPRIHIDTRQTLEPGAPAGGVTAEPVSVASVGLGLGREVEEQIGLPLRGGKRMDGGGG